jgi:hypothetical protein
VSVRDWSGIKSINLVAQDSLFSWKMRRTELGRIVDVCHYQAKKKHA